MRDIFAFRKMLGPAIVKLVFWLGLVLIVWTVVIDFRSQQISLGLQVLIFAPITLRFICEFVIAIFRIQEHMRVIRVHLVNQAEPRT